LGEVVGDVAALVQLAALDQREVTEHRLDCRGECCGAVDHDQQTAGGVEATVDEISQQGLDHRRVLGVTHTEPDRHLRPISSHDKGNNAHRAGEVDTVDHQHRRRQLRQVTCEEAVEGLLRARHEPARHRALRRAAGLGALLGADWVRDPLEAARGDTSEHPFHHDPVQQVTLGEHPEGLQRHLSDALTVSADGMHPGTPDRQALAAHHHRRLRRPTTHMAPLRISGVPLPAQPGGLLGHDRHRRGEPGLDRDRHQALTTRSSDVSQRHRQHIGHRRERRIGLIDQPHSRSVYLLHQVVPLSSGVVEMTPDDARTAPPGGGPPPLYFNSWRDNLNASATALSQHTPVRPTDWTISNSAIWAR
jgi:hypothetical protein